MACSLYFSNFILFNCILVPFIVNFDLSVLDIILFPSPFIVKLDEFAAMTNSYGNSILFFMFIVALFDDIASFNCSKLDISIVL